MVTRFFCSAGLLVVLPSGAVAEDDLQLAVGVDYLAGAEAEAGGHDLVATPLVVSYRTKRVRLQLAIPYLQRLNSSGGKAAPDRNGFGDMVLGIRYSLPLDEKTSIEVSTRARLPTANPALRLGTGSIDLALEAEATRWFGNVGTSLRMGRRLAATCGSYDLRNSWGAGASAFTAIGPASVSLSLDWRQSMFANASDTIEATAGISAKVSRRFRLQGYGYLARSGDRNAAGIGTQVVFRFDP